MDAAPAASTVEHGPQAAQQLIESGKALKQFREMVALQGGDTTVVDDPSRLPRSKHTLEVVSTRNGYVAAIDCAALGTACVVLGGGRARKEDSVDPAVGLVLHKKVTDRVSPGEPLCSIHYNSEERAGSGAGLDYRKLSDRRRSCAE